MVVISYYNSLSMEIQNGRIIVGSFPVINFITIVIEMRLLNFSQNSIQNIIVSQPFSLFLLF